MKSNNIKSFFQIYNRKVEEPSTSEKNFSYNILNYGFRTGQNRYPQNALLSLSNSPTAAAVMKKRVRYIKGSGFNLQDIENVKVNKRESLKEFHAACSETVGKLNGIAIHVNRNLNGSIVALSKIPFEDCRLELPDKNNDVKRIHYNPRWQDPEFKDQETKVYDIYEEDEVKALERITRWKEKYPNKKYPGEIYWNFIKKDGYPYYPFPWSDTDLQAFDTDKAFVEFDYNNTSNNFLLSAIINVYGDPNEIVREQYIDKDGEVKERSINMTRGELFNGQMQEQFGGAKNAGTAMVNWMQNEEQKLDVEAFPNNTNSDLFEKNELRIRNKINLIIDVPNILANMQESGSLSDGNQMLNAVHLINDSVRIQQELLENAYNELIPKHIAFTTVSEPLKIKKAYPFTFIPSEVWEVIPTDAKLKYVKDNFDIEIEEQIETPQTVAKKRYKTFAQESYNDYPQGATNNANKVLEWIEKHGRDEVDAATRVGLERANQLSNREPLTKDTINRTFSFLSRAKTNSILSEEFSGEPWKDKGYVSYLMWGGDVMLRWCEDKLEQIEENE